MPTYDYKCKCGHEWELSRPIVERNDPAVCPNCHNVGRRAFTNAPGLPWYPGTTRSPYKEKRKA